MNFLTLRSFVALLAFMAPVLGFSQEGARRYVIKSERPERVAEFVRQHSSGSYRKMSHFQGVAAELKDSELKLLQKAFPESRIEEDHVVNLLGYQVSGKSSSVTTQPAQSIPWGISAVRATQANQYNRGAGVKVCVVDTGVQASHPDLSGQVVGGENFVVIKGKLDPAKWIDDNGHGTHVSGTIAALDNSIGVVGVAPSAKIFAVKVLNRMGSGYTSDVADGVLSCVRNKAHVISISLGSSSYSSILHDAIKVAHAAGNESTSVSYPAAHPEAIAVSAVDSNLKFASFSNYGPEIAYAAPGVSVNSTVLGGKYAVYSGTSMATPHVAGVMALAISSQVAGLVGVDIGLLSTQQGDGFIDALLTIQH